MNLAILGDNYMYDEEYVMSEFLCAFRWFTYKNIEKCYLLAENKFDKMICSKVKELKCFIPEIKIVYVSFKKDEEYDKDLFDEVEYIDIKIENDKFAEIIRNEYIVKRSDALIVYDSEMYDITPSLRACGVAWMLKKGLVRIGQTRVTTANLK